MTTIAALRRLILNVRVSGDNNFAETDCNYAVITLTPELRQTIRQRVQLAMDTYARDRQLWEMSFWCDAPTFVSTCDCFDGDNEWMDAPVDFATPDAQRIECPQMVIQCSSSDGATPASVWVLFTAIPKHCDYHVLTARIDATEFSDD